jgi:hypothetical protein
MVDGQLGRRVRTVNRGEFLMGLLAVRKYNR